MMQMQEHAALQVRFSICVAMQVEMMHLHHLILASMSTPSITCAGEQFLGSASHLVLHVLQKTFSCIL